MIEPGERFNGYEHHGYIHPKFHIEKRLRGKIVTGVLVVTTAVLSTFCADLALRPNIKSRSSDNTSDFLLNPPGPESVRRSSASNYETLNIPPLPYQR